MSPSAPHHTVEAARPYLVGLTRAVTGLLFACHGAASLFGVLGGAKGGGTVETLSWPGWYAAVIQLVGGTLVLLGLGTRTAAVVCSGSMAYAYFSVHQENGLLPIQNGGESAALFAWTFLLLAATGPGALALDALLPTRRRTATPEPATAPDPAAATA
ncbi:DoxX family protein [Kitasatospora sp. NPDC088783]|uniref:DoxX family protein n=1 Tax=Kitasatospora sp. NPDC088783 TaxID=3364077 RepID=UPI003808FB8C